jgi:hypothetical protein
MLITSAPEVTIVVLMGSDVGGWLNTTFNGARNPWQPGGS